MLKHLQKEGFTLIELLIVIALLGALAVGLLAALDPFEQLKKGTDTGVRNTVSELHGAVIRFFAIKTEMPWGTSTVSANVSTGYSNTFSIPEIIDTGELKSDFSTLAGNQLKHITMLGTSDSLTVCYKPTSKAFQSDPNTKYNATTFIDTGSNNVTNCGTPGTASFKCVWCVK